MPLEKIGRFKVLRLLGKGAMGEVYLAYDPDLDRELAIKTIVYEQGIPEEEIKEARLRFRREARVAAKMGHPNIVIIHDVGEQDGMPFIAMEFIQGETLEQYVKPSSLLPLTRVIEIIGQSADGLDHAHRNELVHRDIKPANIMLTQDGTVKVMDFGLAKKPSANLTQAGMLLGTPSYMSPEQIKGESLDGRTDLFSLGVVLYQMLTGEKPFHGDSISTIMYKILNEDAREPSLINAKLPREFDGIVKKALAKNSAERFQTGKEFKLAIDNYINFTSTMSRIQAPDITGPVGEATANLPAASLRPTPMPAKVAIQEKASIAKPLVIIALLVAFLAVGYGPAKSWMKTKSMDESVPIPTFLVMWANDGENPRELDYSILINGLPAESERVAFLLDNLPHDSAMISIPRTKPRGHKVVVRTTCQEAVHQITQKDIDAKSIVLDFKDAIVPFTVETKPSDASVQVFEKNADGKYGDVPIAEGKTPLTTDVNLCKSPLKIVLTEEGYVSTQPQYHAISWDKTTFPIDLEALPKPGKIRFKQSHIKYQVIYKNKTLARSGGTVELEPKTYNVTLVNRKVFLSRAFSFDVSANDNKTVNPNIGPLGNLSVRILGNAEILIDNFPAEKPPFTDLKIVTGQHNISFHLRAGNTVHVTVHIKAGKRTIIQFKEEDGTYTIR